MADNKDFDERERRLNEWPRTQAKLQLLGQYSREIQLATKKLQLILEMLTERPDFETMAEHELKLAEQIVATTHAFLKTVNEQYPKLPASA